MSATELLERVNAVDEAPVTTCPCCNGQVRVSENGRHLEIVRLTKPDTPWKPGTWVERYERMHQLRRANLTFTAIANLLALDHGLDLDKDKVRQMVNGNVSMRTVQRHLS